MALLSLLLSREMRGGVEEWDYLPWFEAVRIGEQDSDRAGSVHTVISRGIPLIHLAQEDRFYGGLTGHFCPEHAHLL